MYPKCGNRNNVQPVYIYIYIHTFTYIYTRNKMADKKTSKLVAVIGDEDTVAGFLLAGTGERTASGQNYFCVDSNTPRAQIERAFEEFTTREDIAIILINQHISEEIRYLVENYDGTIPTVLEIPSKGKAYDPRKDTIMKRVSAMLGKDL